MLLHFLSILILASCSQQKSKISPEDEKQPSKQVLVNGFQDVLDSANVKGAILFYDLKKDIFYSNDFEWSKAGRLPASTFKIPNSIIALESEIVENDSTLLRWDREPRAMKIWEKDLTFKQAFHLSCVPCYQEIARKVGFERMQQFVVKFDYGDLDISPKNIDKFWLEGNSKVSQFQQIAFLRKLYLDSLPISNRTSRIIRRMMVMKTSSDYTLSGKTGWAVRGNHNNGWFVGYIESAGNTFLFATNIEPGKEFVRNEFLSARKAVTMKAFKIVSSSEKLI